MFHLAHRSAAYHAGTIPSAGGAIGRVILSTPEVLLGTSAVAAVSAVPAPRRAGLLAAVRGAIGHIHLGLPEPRPVYPRREGNYFEAARMSRYMDRL